MRYDEIQQHWVPDVIKLLRYKNRLDDIGMESKVSIGVWLSLDVSILDVRFHCVETWHQQV